MIEYLILKSLYHTFLKYIKLFLEEFRTLYCRYSAMDDSKSSKTK